MAPADKEVAKQFWTSHACYVVDDGWTCMSDAGIIEFGTARKDGMLSRMLFNLFERIGRPTTDRVSNSFHEVEWHLGGKRYARLEFCHANVYLVLEDLS